MKQLLVLLTFLLIILLMISAVMAVGNVKQSEQMALRTQLISDLRAELRKERAAQQQMKRQQMQQSAITETLRVERDALSKRFGTLMGILQKETRCGMEQLPALQGSRFFAALPPLHHKDELPGESWLQAQALMQALHRQEPPALAGDPKPVEESPVERTADQLPLAASAALQTVGRLAAEAAAPLNSGIWVPYEPAASSAPAVEEIEDEKAIEETEGTEALEATEEREGMEKTEVTMAVDAARDTPDVACLLVDTVKASVRRWWQAVMWIGQRVDGMVERIMNVYIAQGD